MMICTLNTYALKQDGAELESIRGGIWTWIVAGAVDVVEVVILLAQQLAS